SLTLREFGPVWCPAVLLLAASGLVQLCRSRNLTLFWFVVVALLSNLAYNVNYEIAEDKDAYYLPVFVSIAIAAAFGARLLVGAHNRTWLSELPAALLALVFGVAAGVNCAYDTRRGYFIARDYVDNMLSTVEPGGMLLTMDWQVYSPMFYLREIEDVRRDVVVIDVNQLRRSWYFDYLRRAYPEVMDQSRDRVDAFV